MKDAAPRSVVNHILIYDILNTKTNIPMHASKLGAGCVRKSDDSRNSAIRIAYRISLRSSSLWEPRYPSLKIYYFIFLSYSRFRE